MTIKTTITLALLIGIYLYSCAPNNTTTEPSTAGADTIAPVIVLRGKKIDTTFLQISSTTLIANAASGYTWLPGSSSNYSDPGAYLGGTMRHGINCQDISVTTTGFVNNRLPGRYFLYYDAIDLAGNHAATVTRTVDVVENGASFLNGVYNVFCTCIASKGSAYTPTISKNNYMANITMSGVFNNHFELGLLNVGAEYITTSASLKGDSIILPFYVDHLVYYSDASARGILSATRKSFIIETDMRTRNPDIHYKCRNIYTKVEKEHTVIN